MVLTGQSHVTDNQAMVKTRKGSISLRVIAALSLVAVQAMAVSCCRYKKHVSMYWSLRDPKAIFMV